jgi:hypothetical protein
MTRGMTSRRTARIKANVNESTRSRAREVFLLRAPLNEIAGENEQQEGGDENLIWLESRTASEYLVGAYVA